MRRLTMNERCGLIAFVLLILSGIILAAGFMQ